MSRRRGWPGCSAARCCWRRVAGCGIPDQHRRAGGRRRARPPGGLRPARPAASHRPRTASGSRPRRRSSATSCPPQPASRIGRTTGSSSSSPRRTAAGSQEKQGSEVALNVVRLPEKPVFTENGQRTSVTVRMPVQQIGAAAGQRHAGPPVATDTEYEFGLRGSAEAGHGEHDGRRLYVIDPPSVLLLSDDRPAPVLPGPETIYFWNSDRTRLVRRPALPAAGRAGRAAGQRGGEVADRPAPRTGCDRGRRPAGPHRA